MKETLRASPAY